MSANKISKRSLTAVILALILLVATTGIMVNFYAENNSLKSQLAASSLEIENLNSAQLKLSDPDNPVGGEKYGSPQLGWTNENSALYIHGAVFNVGTSPALNSKIHVVASLPDGTKLLDDYIDIGTIEGGFMAKIDTRIESTLPLIGNFSVTCTPEWS